MEYKIQLLVDIGEMTQEEADLAILRYHERQAAEAAEKASGADQ